MTGNINQGQLAVCDCNQSWSSILPKPPCPVHGNQSVYNAEIRRRIKQIDYQFNQSSVEKRLSDLENQVSQLLEKKAGHGVAATIPGINDDKEMAGLRNKLENLQLRLEIARLGKELEEMV